MRLLYLLVPVLFLAFVQPSQASALRAISIAKVKKKSSGGILASVRYKGKASNDPSFTSSANDPIYTAVVEISKASLGSVVKKRAFSPWGAALTVALTASGYVLDTNTGTISQTPSSNPLPTTSGYCSISGTNTTISDCLSQADSIDSAYAPHTVGNFVSALPGYDIIRSNYPSSQNSTYYGFAWWGSSNLGDLSNSQNPTPQTVPDPDIWDAVEPGLDSSTIRDLLHDPETGFPEPLPEITSKGADLGDSIGRAYDGDPSNDPTSVPEPLSPGEVTVQQGDERLGGGGGGDGEPPDYTANFTDLEFPTDLPDLEQEDISDVLDPLFETSDNITDDIGITATAGDCKVTTSWVMGGYTGDLSMSFCMFANAFQAMGFIIYSIAAVYSALILFGAK